MNNPGIDVEIWKRLKQKWAKLEAQGHKVKIDFKLIADSKNEKNILAIDVIQHIDKWLITETVQKVAGEAYAPLGIAGLTLEQLKELVRDMLREIEQTKDAIQLGLEPQLMMTYHSATSGEVQGLLVHPDAPVQSAVPVNYRYYYVLNALRDKMIELTEAAWSSVRVDDHKGDVDFYFEYPKEKRP